MKFLYKYGTRSNEIRRARRELYFRLTMVIAALVFFAIMVLVTKFRPRLEQEAEQALPDTANAGDPMANPRLNEQRAEVDLLLGEYASRSEESPVDLDDMELLEKAIDLQREIIRYRGSDIAPKSDLDRMKSMQTMYDEEMGAFLMAQSKRLEEEAEESWTAGNPGKAIEQLNTAINLQDQINSQYPLSSNRNPSRLYELGNKSLFWKTQPMAEEADRLKEEAFALVEQKQYGKARQAIGKALEIQQTLNREYRTSRMASIARLKDFEDAFRTVENAEDVDSVEVLVREGRVALTAGEAAEAVAKAERAVALQRKIMGREPVQLPQQVEKLRQIQILQETAASYDTHARIEELQEETRSALRNRDPEAFRQLVADWLRQTQSMQSRFPNSELTTEVDAEEVNFLYDHREAIPSILEMVHNNLLEVPDTPGLYLYRTEVPQVLYTQISGTNPASSRNPAKPIESVTWEEARRFVERLSWILVRPVSLPSRETYLKAIGEVRIEELPAQTWSSENTNRESQPVGSASPNPFGFQDLLGNVAEWMDLDPSDPDRVMAIGGSARDARIRLATIPEEPRSRTERNRFIGFRFTVEIAK